MKIENLPVPDAVSTEKDNEKSTPEEFLFKVMLSEWQSRVISSDGLTDEDNAEW